MSYHPIVPMSAESASVQLLSCSPVGTRPVGCVLGRSVIATNTPITLTTAFRRGLTRCRLDGLALISVSFILWLTLTLLERGYFASPGGVGVGGGRLRVCVCLCISVCMCVCLCLCLPVCVCICILLSTYVYLCLCQFVSLSVFVLLCLSLYASVSFCVTMCSCVCVILSVYVYR